MLCAPSRDPGAPEVNARTARATRLRMARRSAAAQPPDAHSHGVTPPEPLGLLDRLQAWPVGVDHVAHLVAVDPHLRGRHGVAAGLGNALSEATPNDQYKDLAVYAAYQDRQLFWITGSN
jgi:hypothetical protein